MTMSCLKTDHREDLDSALLPHPGFLALHGRVTCDAELPTAFRAL